MSNEINETEIVDEKREEKKEEKKDGFFKKMKDKFNDATYESRMLSDFKKTHKEYSIYTGAQLLSKVYTVYAFEYDGYIIGYVDTEDEILNNYIIKCEETKKAFYIDNVSKKEFDYVFEGKTNVIKGIMISFKDEAKKVEVIKVENDYYEKRH